MYSMEKPTMRTAITYNYYLLYVYMLLASLCPPALLYVGFSLAQIFVDTIKGLYNAALFKFVVMVIFTILLNTLCRHGLGLVCPTFSEEALERLREVERRERREDVNLGEIGRRSHAHPVGDGHVPFPNVRDVRA